MDSDIVNLEESVIGAAMIDPAIVGEMAEFLRPSDFEVMSNRFLWEAILSLHEKRQAIDIATVPAELKRLGRDVGEPYIVALISRCPSSLNGVDYARLVHEAGVRRGIIAAAQKIASAAADRRKPITELSELATATIHDAVNGSFRGRSMPVAAAVSEYYDTISDNARRGGVLGTPTGILSLDLKLGGGLQPDDFMIIAGRPGTGKTSLLLSVTRLMSERGLRGIFFSLEMSRERLVNRLLAAVSGVDGQKIRAGKMSEEEWGSLNQAVGEVERWPLLIDDTRPLSPIAVRNRCANLKFTGGLDFLVVDYIQLMNGVGERREQEIAYITRNLKLIAGEFGVPVIAAAQLSRAPEARADRRPTMADLRESGAQEQDADEVVLLWKDEGKNATAAIGKRVVTIILDKNRDGPIGEFDMIFDENTTRFYPAETKVVSFQ